MEQEQLLYLKTAAVNFGILSVFKPSRRLSEVPNLPNFPRFTPQVYSIVLLGLLPDLKPVGDH